VMEIVEHQGQKRVKFEYQRERLSTGTNEVLRLKCSKKEKDTLGFMLAAAITEYQKKLENCVKSYHVEGEGWILAAERPLRCVKSVVLPNNQVDNLMKDVKRFFDDGKNQTSIYKLQGLPYRRGYLFYGIPGSGKSTLAYCLASDLHRPLYVIQFGSSEFMSDTILQKLFIKVPPGSIILLEDVDAAQKNREKESMYGGTIDCMRGLLNCLDGVISYAGSIVIATTNYYDKLDPALKRKGRFDYTLEFKPPTVPQICELYSQFFGNKNAVEFKKEITTVLKERLPLCMADIQAHFIKHMNDSERSVKNIRSIVSDPNNNNCAGFPDDWWK